VQTNRFRHFGRCYAIVSVSVVVGSFYCIGKASCRHSKTIENRHEGAHQLNNYFSFTTKILLLPEYLRDQDRLVSELVAKRKHSKREAHAIPSIPDVKSLQKHARSLFAFWRQCLPT